MTRADTYFSLFIIISGIIFVLLQLPNIRSHHTLSKRLERKQKERKIYIKYLSMLNLKVNPKNYRIVQYVVTLILAIYLILIFYSTKKPPYVEGFVVLLIVLFLIPETGLFILTWIKSKFSANKSKIQTEIYKAMLEIRMLSKLRYTGNSSQIIKRIIEGTVYITPELNKIKLGWNNTNHEDLIDEFVASIGTEEAQELGAILLKLDDVNTEEFDKQIDLYQKKIFARRQTNKEINDRQKSDVLYTLVILDCVMVMVNFVFIIMNEGINMIYTTF